MKIIDLSKEDYLDRFLPETQLNLCKVLLSDEIDCLFHEKEMIRDCYFYHYYRYMSPEDNRAVVPFWGLFPYHHSFLCDQLINQIPIFLVDKSLANKVVTVEEMGSSYQLLIPRDNLSVVDCEPKEKFQEDDKGIFLERPQKYSEFNRKDECGLQQNIDLLGLYESEFPNYRTSSHYQGFSFKNIHCRIYIWVDKIWDCVSATETDNDYSSAKLRSNFNLLFTQVLLHECMHALMDVYRFHNTQNVFYTIKEESLANAASFWLMKKVLKINKTDSKYLENFIQKQPFQYRLGLAYQDDYLLERAFSTWLEIKMDETPSPIVINKWLKYIGSHQSYDKEQLGLFEDALVGLDIFEYNGKLFIRRNAVLEVIREYLSQHSNTSCTELKQAFPDNLNDQYSVFADWSDDESKYLGVIDKEKTKESGATVYEKGRCFDAPNERLHCSDGVLVVCDLWYSLDKFIKNAQALGFAINDICDGK